MAQPMEDDPLLAALAKEEQAAEEAAAAEADEAIRLKQQERPNSWTPLDAYQTKGQWPKPEGFLEADQLLRRANVCLLFGKGGVFKTWFTMFLLGQVGRGLKVNQFDTRVGKTLFLSEELDEPTMKERMMTLWTEDEAGEIDDTMRIRCDSNLDFYSRTLESQKRLERIWKEENKPDLIAIDALSYIQHGNENSNQDMGLVFGSIKDVAKETNSNVLVIHHTGKPNEFRKGGDLYRGASVIQNICSDMILIDSGVGRQSVVKFTKHRDWRGKQEIAPFSFGLEENPNDPRCVMLAFSQDDVTESSINPAHIEEMVRAVDELAGPGGEVLRMALWLMMEGRGWGKLRFKLVLGEAVRVGRLARVKRGKEAGYYIPRGMGHTMSDSNDDPEHYD